MEYAANITVDGIGIALLLLLYFNFGAKTIRRKTIEQRSFDALVLLLMGIMTESIITWVLKNYDPESTRAWNRALITIGQLMETAAVYIWLIYCVHILYGNRKKARRLCTIFFVPILVSLGFIICNLFVPIVFDFTQNNDYIKEKYYYLHMSMLGICLIATFVMALRALMREKNPGKKAAYRAMVIYPLLPLVTIAVQALLNVVSIIWIGGVFSLLLLYFNVQNSQIYTDALTGTNNRKKYVQYIETKIENYDGKSILFLIILDIDNFKHINDNYGHLIGDDAICEFSKILTGLLQSTDFIARVGGDEFVIVGSRDSVSEVDVLIKKIRGAFTQRNEQRQSEFCLTASIGMSLMQEDTRKTPDELFREADTNMYIEKTVHHNTDDSSKRRRR